MPGGRTHDDDLRPRWEVLVFELDGQPCAIRTASVVEIVHAVAITPLPDAPALVEGVVNFRGRVMPVVDARAWFHKASRALDPGDHFIVATAGARGLVLRVDRVTDIAIIDAPGVPGRAERAPGAYLDAVVEIAGGLVVIRDVAAFLTEAEGRTLDAALAAGSAA